MKIKKYEPLKILRELFSLQHLSLCITTFASGKCTDTLQLSQIQVGKF